MTQIPVLTKKEAEKVIQSIKKEQNLNKSHFLGHFFVLVSLDLGVSVEKIKFENGFLYLRDQIVSLSEFKNLKDETIYTIVENRLLAVELFDQKTNFYYKLKPTPDWPALMISSVPMHRFKNITPKKSAEEFVKQIDPVYGVVLDTCCGLGYTSILESIQKDCKKVIVFEKDLNVLKIAEYNPFSNSLFTNKKIELAEGDVFEKIKEIKTDSVDRILHDPPTTSFAPILYSEEFYYNLFRVLKKRGKLFHYCPNPKKTKGVVFWHSVEKKLHAAGFSNIKYVESASGLRAEK